MTYVEKCKQSYLQSLRHEQTSIGEPVRACKKNDIICKILREG